MSFSFGSPTTTTGSTFGTTTPSTGFAFGSGDAAKPTLFGSPSTGADTKPAFNFTSPTGGFAFGAKTTAPASSLFASPTATNANTGFGANKSLSFGAPPPNQTVGSPGFGQPQPQAQPQSTPFGLGQQSTPAPAFGTPAAQGSAFGDPNNAFAFKPATTTATPGFGFSTPATGFGAAQPTALSTSTPASQPAQSAFGGTPAFGQTSFGAKPGGFSFGSTATTSAAAPAFGAATAPAFGAATAPTAAQPTLGFGSTAPASTGLSFGTTPAAAPATTTSFSFNPAATAQHTTGFGTQPTSQSTGLSFGTQPSQPSALNFGAQPTSQPGLNFGAQGTSQPSSLSFGAQTTAQPATGLGFGTQPSSQPSSIGFGTQPSQATPAASLSFGPQPGQAATGLNFGTPATQASTGLSFGTTTAQATQGVSFSTPASSTSQPALSFGTTPSTAAAKPLTLTGAPTLSFASTTASTSAPALGFGTTPASSTSQPAAGVKFGTTPASSASQPLTSQTSTALTGFGTLGKATSAASSIAPSGIMALGKTTATTTMPSLNTVTTTTTAAPPQPISSINFAELEENINKWTLELEEQEKTFINQATQINAWDRLLIANGEKIVELNDAVETVKNEQQNLEHELEFVFAQQKELEELLAPMETQLMNNKGDVVRDVEREHMYSLAENLDTQLRQMSEDLKEVIEHLNETNRAQDTNDPIVQIGRILNTHMSSMQWIDNSIAQISNKLDQLKVTHDTLRRDNERSFQLTYN